METLAQKKSIKLEGVMYVDNQQDQVPNERDYDQDELAHNNLTINVSNFSENARIHVFGTQFIPNIGDSMRDVMEKYLTENSSITTFPFS